MNGIQVHPCFSTAAHYQYGRLHLPIAPLCNIVCSYCERKFDCPNEARPGVSSHVMSEIEALDYARSYLRQHPETTVVGIAGPGEPLVNPTTFFVLSRLQGVIKCVSTNGLLLPKRLKNLQHCGVDALTVTINTLRPATALQLYQGVDTEQLLHCQQYGATLAIQKGMHVKINTVLVTGINDTEAEILPIAEFAASIGAKAMNINALIPAGSLKDASAPNLHKVQYLREAASKYIPQFRHCRQCRADAAGIPGQESLTTAMIDKVQIPA